jgi:hypothetical protein
MGFSTAALPVSRVQHRALISQHVHKFQICADFYCYLCARLTLDLRIPNVNRPIFNAIGAVLGQHEFGRLWWL